MSDRLRHNTKTGKKRSDLCTGRLIQIPYVVYRYDICLDRRGDPDYSPGWNPGNSQIHPSPTSHGVV